MQTLRIPYTTWIAVLDSNPTWVVYQQTDGQSRYVWAGNLDYLFNTTIKQEDRSNYDAWVLNRNITQVINEDDAIAHIVGIGQLQSLRSAKGLQGQSPAKGLGGFAPDPNTNPYEPDSEEVVSLYADTWGQLMTRGPVLTDEGSLRDDFTGSSLETVLTGTLTFTQGSREVTGINTQFTTELNRNHYIKPTNNTNPNQWARIIRATSDTHLILDSEYQGTTTTYQTTKTKWITTNPDQCNLNSSDLVISSGTDQSEVHVYRQGDYLPCVAVWRSAITQRIANQTTYFGFRDDPTNPNMYAEVNLTGTDPTKVVFRTAWNSDEESSTVSVPSGLNTSMSLRYKIDVSATYCALLINGVPVVKHENHIPDPYASFNICCGITNTQTVTNTDLTIDSVYFANTDVLQVSSMFSEAIPVVTTEDQHTINSLLTTTSTTSNQTVISYTIPEGRVLFIIGYLVDAEGTANGVIRIGRNDLTTEPSAPGSIDDNFFRSRFIPANGSYFEDFGANPRRLGVGGDTILLTVTPDSLLATKWRCAIDFVLR